MSRRSYADVPNRIVRLFLEEAGLQYDTNRGFTPFRSMTPELIDRFGNACAYCGETAALVAEHLVPINRKSVGLHAWGNIVPSCKNCNDIKAGNRWQEHPKLNEARRTAIQIYIKKYEYSPDVTELGIVLEKLYALADQQTRALVAFAVVASRPHIAGLHTSPPAGLVEPSAASDDTGF